MHDVAEAELTAEGISGDRAFLLVDERGTMIASKRLGALLSVIADHDADAGRLSLRFPDGREVAGSVELGEPEDMRFYRRSLRVRPVTGPFSDALSDHAETRLRLVTALPERTGIDRGRDGAVSLLSTASLERLRAVSGAGDPVDQRRFRMNVGIDGVAAHEEDAWLGRDVRIGTALVRVRGNVGRCAATTRNAETGVVDFQTLHHLQAYRAEVKTTEPLPFGVYARVLEPGRVRLGDSVALAS